MTGLSHRRGGYPLKKQNWPKKMQSKLKQTNYDEATFNLLFKDDLQEREVARVLLEYGIRKYDETKLVAEYMLEEMVDESLIDNTDVLRLIAAFKELLQTVPETARRNYFIYHPDTKLSAFAVSLLNFPYEESDHWKKESSQSTGYQNKLFKQSYEDFIESLAVGNDDKLMKFLKIDEDSTNEEVDSAINYLKLRKIKRMLLRKSGGS